MAHFILVHGAFHGGWCWERLTPLLEARGHRVEAPDLPGMGDDRTPFADNVLDQWAEFIAQRCRAASEPVVLVGHSRGGIVISEVAERVPERIATLVYLAAFLIPSGAVLLHEMQQQTGLSQLPVAPTADGISMVFDKPLARQFFFSDFDEEQAAPYADRLCLEPIDPNMRPLLLTEERFGQVDKAYVVATADGVLSVAAQKAMADAGGCTRIVEIASDHSPFLSAPDALATILSDLA